MPYLSTDYLNQVNVHFIMGAARSGTTLLTTIFNASDKVFCAPENQLIMTFYKDFAHQNPVQSRFTQRLAQYMSPRLKRLELKKDYHVFDQENLNKDIFLQFDTQKGLDYANTMRTLLLNIQLSNKDNTKVDTLISKDPDNVFFVKEFLQIYPNAKFIAALRDPRAVVLSHKQSKGNAGGTLTRAYVWKKFNEALLDALQQYPDRILLVRYETMVTQTESTIHQICEFLNIAFDANMVNPEKSTAEQLKRPDTEDEATDRRKKRWTDLSKPINTTRMEVWKTALSPREIQITNTICQPIAEQLGYDLGQKTTAFEQLKTYLSQPKESLFAVLYYLILIKYYYQLPFSWRLWAVKKLNLTR